MKIGEALFTIAIIVALVIFLGAVFALPVMWLWNVALVPAIPGIKAIGFLQAWGIMILTGFLFKNTNATSTSSK